MLGRKFKSKGLSTFVALNIKRVAFLNFDLVRSIYQAKKSNNYALCINENSYHPIPTTKLISNAIFKWVTEISSKKYFSQVILNASLIQTYITEEWIQCFFENKINNNRDIQP